MRLNPPKDASESWSVKIEYIQAREVHGEEWALNSLDNVLGLVGGFTGLLWSVLSFVMGSFETFRLENQLIGSAYSIAPAQGEETPRSEKQANHTMMSAVAESGPYNYGPWEHRLA